MVKNNNNKPTISCRICNKKLIKKYISMHIKLKHKNDQYCKFISRGITYTKFENKNLLFKIKNQFYCSICNKLMKMTSKNHHAKSKIHLLLSNTQKNSVITKLSVQQDNKSNIDSIDNNDIDFKIFAQGISDSNKFSILNATESKNKEYKCCLESSQNDMLNFNKINFKTDILNPHKEEIDVIIGGGENKKNINKINNKEIIPNRNIIISTISKSNSNYTSSYEEGPSTIKSLGHCGFNISNDDPFIEKEIQEIIERFEIKKRQKKELEKYRDRERKKEKKKRKHSPE